MVSAALSAFHACNVIRYRSRSPLVCTRDIHSANESSDHLISSLLCSLSDQSSLSGVRSMSEYTGPWPGPNPLKDVFYGLSLGLVLAIGFKSWQIKDKADRVHFYQEYERAVRVEEARKEKDRQDKAASGETDEESEEEPTEDE